MHDIDQEGPRDDELAVRKVQDAQHSVHDVETRPDECIDGAEHDAADDCIDDQDFVHVDAGYMR